MVIPDNFERVREEGASLLVRSDVRDWLVPLLVSVARGSGEYATRGLGGGRGGAAVVRVNGYELVLRSCRRGGLPARVLHDTYFGVRPRPFREVIVLETLRRRQVPVVEAMGACVRWLAPGCYRGWVATRYVPGARTLWDWASGGAGGWDRGTVWQLVGKAVRQLHAAGATHPDLNLRNILLAPGGAVPRVVFVDFDRPRLSGRGNGEADLARLERSAHKLDPQGRWVTPADLQRLHAAYDEGAT